MAALARYDNNEFDEALTEFDAISDTSKILFNCGVIHATLGQHEKAVSTTVFCSWPNRHLTKFRSNAIKELCD